MASSEHGRLIANAAKEFLLPLNFKRYKQSRVYIRDEGFWLNGVSFDPSGFSKGSYLTVFAHWLWHPRGHLSFDHGGRIHTPEYGGFIRYVDPEQFAAAARNFAEAAAIAALALQRELASIDVVARLLVAQQDSCALQSYSGSWPAFHAGVASGLAGDVESARRMFASVLITSGVEPLWLTSLMAISVQLADALKDPKAFNRSVQDYVDHHCALYGLAEDAKRLAFD